ncbi:MAG: hypothetical protein WCF24_11635 [Acidimicrobiales bacterium]
MDRSDERPHVAGDVERYETLRARALCGDASGWRLGLAVLERQGVAAWLRLGEAISTPTPTRSAELASIDNDALVGVLSEMALACLGGR